MAAEHTGPPLVGVNRPRDPAVASSFRTARHAQGLPCSSLAFAGESQTAASGHALRRGPQILQTDDVDRLSLTQSAHVHISDMRPACGPVAQSSVWPSAAGRRCRHGITHHLVHVIGRDDLAGIWRLDAAILAYREQFVGIDLQHARPNVHVCWLREQEG